MAYLVKTEEPEGGSKPPLQASFSTSGLLPTANTRPTGSPLPVPLGPKAQGQGERSLRQVRCFSKLSSPQTRASPPPGSHRHWGRAGTWEEKESHPLLSASTCQPQCSVSSCLISSLSSEDLGSNHSHRLCYLRLVP